MHDGCHLSSSSREARSRRPSKSRNDFDPSPQIPNRSPRFLKAWLRRPKSSLLITGLPKSESGPCDSESGPREFRTVSCRSTGHGSVKKAAGAMGGGKGGKGAAKGGQMTSAVVTSAAVMGRRKRAFLNEHRRKFSHQGTQRKFSQPIVFYMAFIQAQGCCEAVYSQGLGFGA